MSWKISVILYQNLDRNSDPFIKAFLDKRIGRVRLLLFKLIRVVRPTWGMAPTRSKFSHMLKASRRLGYSDQKLDHPEKY